MNYQSRNWRGWIKEKFGDKSKFNIEISEEKIKYTVRSSDPSIKTQIMFYFMRPDDDDVLYDIHFSGGDITKNNIWFSPFTVDKNYMPKLRDRIQTPGLATSLIFEPEFLNRLEKEWLYIPLQKGWNEEVHYVGEKIYRAKMRINENNSESWDKNESVPFELNGLDYIKTWLHIDTKTEKFEFKPIEK